MNNLREINVSDLIRRLREEGMEAIVEVYELYRNDFLHFGKKYGASREILLSAWHDAVIAFYEIALADRYDPEKSNLKTYLFTIAKYKVLDALKKEGKVVDLEKVDVTITPISPFLEEENLTTQAHLLQTALHQLGEKCREILVLTYYHQYAAEAIQQRMNYDNANVVYSHKSRCLKQLKAVFKRLTAE
mgnify:CR=1 FL=1